MTSSFESNSLYGWSTAGVGEVVPTVESYNVREGADAARVLLTGTQIRSELIFGGVGDGRTTGMVEFHEGDEYWYGFSIDILQMVYGKPGAHNLIMQFKSEGEGSPAFGLQLWNYNGQKGLWSHSTAMGGDRFLSEISENAWHDIAIHFKASSQGAGFYEVFLDGHLVDARSGVSMIVPGKSMAYIKNGIYRNGPTNPGTSEILLDAAKLGTTMASVQPR